MTITKKPRFKYPPLIPQPLRELATLNTSGIPLADAWAKSSVMNHPAGPVILRKLQKGSSLPAALEFLGLITAAQQIYLAAANNAGNLSQALLHLASDVESRDEHRRMLKSKFFVIYLLLFVGWGAGLVVAIAEPQNWVNAFVFNSVWCLLCLAFIRMLLNIVLKDGWWWLDTSWRFSIKDHKAFQWILISYWYALLGSQLAAGVDVASALDQMKGLLGQSAYRKAIVNASIAIEEGQPLSQALADNDLLPNVEFRTILESAEAGGRLSETLDHQRLIAEQQLEVFQSNIMFWIPKGLYGLCGAVALLMVL